MRFSQPSAGIQELDLHGMNRTQAEAAINARLKKAGPSVYRIRVIHGFHGGTALKELAEGYRRHPKVLRIERGLNQGETDLILREL
ncbi:MAG: Smr/MutS family protein [Oscillospiraceae bacterium]|nr:Smr/MutS family protein [Oscillospiraceae bacterium]